MTYKKPINWAIIGTGNIAHKFATDLQKVPNTSCYAVASRSIEKATQFANKFGFKKSYGSYEELAKDTNVDAVYIATPHALHKENTLLYLNNKIAVLCEKPFAMNLGEIEEMIQAAKDNDTLLMEALWTYFLPHYQYVLKVLENKDLGNVVSLKADFGFYKEFNENDRLFNKKLGGGSLLDIGIYPIFVALTVLGVPLDIKATASYFDNGADSSCTMEFEYPNQVKAYLKSTLIEDTPTAVIIECTHGTIKVSNNFYQPTNVFITQNGTTREIDFTDANIGYYYEAEHFTNLLLEGRKASNIMTFQKSILLMKQLDSVRKIIKLDY